LAVNIVELAGQLDKKSQSARILSAQILRAGTSIGSNVEEAQAGESKADFIHKYNIALKEARETKYWLRLLRASNMAPDANLALLTKEADEISRIIAQIIINARKEP
jgi:four helix bundle protein